MTRRGKVLSAAVVIVVLAPVLWVAYIIGTTIPHMGDTAGSPTLRPSPSAVASADSSHPIVSPSSDQPTAVASAAPSSGPTTMPPGFVLHSTGSFEIALPEDWSLTGADPVWQAAAGVAGDQITVVSVPDAITEEGNLSGYADEAAERFEAVLDIDGQKSVTVVAGLPAVRYDYGGRSRTYYLEHPTGSGDAWVVSMNGAETSAAGTFDHVIATLSFTDTGPSFALP